MNTIKKAVLIILAFSFASQAERTEQITIPLSNPGEPGILIINHHKGSINVTGYDGELVVVTATMRYGTSGLDADDSEDIAAELIYLGAMENNNNVFVNTTPRHRTIDLDIMVPYRFSVRLKKDDSGIITVNHLSGEMDVSNLNGDILLTDISGSAALDTVDGDITAQFKNVLSGVPMAFSSIEGNIDITFPENTNALVKVKSDHGTIQNDFGPEQSTPKQLTAETTNYGRWNYQEIGDGGQEIRFMSFFGNIYIRKTVKTKK